MRIPTSSHMHINRLDSRKPDNIIIIKIPTRKRKNVTQDKKENQK
jgi:hypothetical protein